MIDLLGNRKDIASLLTQAYNKFEPLEYLSVSPVPAHKEVEMYPDRSIPLKLIMIFSCIIIYCPNVPADDLPNKSVYSDRVSFGFEYDDEILCYPNFIKPVIPGELCLLADSLRALTGKSRHDIIPLPPGFLDNSVYDKVGDTVTAIWSAGKFRASIEEMRLIPTFDLPFVGCVLKMIDPIPEPLSWKTIVVYKGSKGYSELLIPLEEYSLNDSDRQRLTKVLTDYIISNSEQIWRKWLEQDLFDETNINRRKQLIEHYENYFGENPAIFNNPEIAIYAKEYSSLPDTFFLSFKRKMHRGRLLIFRAVHQNNDFKILSLPSTAQNHWGDNYIIDCSFDLDNDGYYEYLIMKDIAAEILELVEGKFIKIAKCGYGR